MLCDVETECFCLFKSNCEVIFKSCVVFSAFYRLRGKHNSMINVILRCGCEM